jgi:hypothetical protein
MVETTAWEGEVLKQANIPEMEEPLFIERQVGTKKQIARANNHPT